jgi:hypothetical protein
MVTVLEAYRRTALFVRFLLPKGLNAKEIHEEMFPAYGWKCLSGEAIHKWVEKFSQGRSKVAGDARPGAVVAQTTVAFFHTLVSDGTSLWRICLEINVSFFQFRISHALRFTSICDLFTDSHLICRNETPCTPEKSHRRFGGMRCLRLKGQRISQGNNQQEQIARKVANAGNLLGLHFNLEMEAVRSSETSVNICQTTCNYILKDPFIFAAVRSSNSKLLIKFVKISETYGAQNSILWPREDVPLMVGMTLRIGCTTLLLPPPPADSQSNGLVTRNCYQWT